jgi:transcriptional regulator GlxA family with amidase domain
MRTGKDDIRANRLVRFGFILTEQFSLLAFTGFIDSLRKLEDHGKIVKRRYCDWSILGAAGQSVRSSCGIAITADAPMANAENYDFVVVVGGRPGALISSKTVSFLRQAAKRRATMIALDTGSFVLARHGFLDRIRICVHWYHYREFVELFPSLDATAGHIFIVDGARITCCGGTCTIDLAAHLIESIWGQREARRAITLMGLERTRSSSHFQTPFFDDLGAVRNARVRRAIQIMESRPNRPLSIQAIAKSLGTSTRQLERAFSDAVGKSPSEFSRQSRLHQGHWLLLNSARSVSQIAFDCGFSDSSHFTRFFQREFGVSPRQLRNLDRQNASVAFVTRSPSS